MNINTRDWRVQDDTTTLLRNNNGEVVGYSVWTPELEPIEYAPIVRCKDCKFFNLAKNGWNGSCDLRIDAFNGFYANDFCSFGEKK